eukprot:CFRG2948T1
MKKTASSTLLNIMLGRIVFSAFALVSSLRDATMAATNGIHDTSSAYDFPVTWDTVDRVELKTFVTNETDNYTFTQMYKDSAGPPKKKMGVCMRSDDYPESLSAPCGKLHVRGKSSREAELKSMKVKLDKTAPLGKWRGRRDVIFIKSPYDMARIRNAVAYKLISEIDGFIGIGVAYVHLWVDGIDYGLYHVVEDIDDDYLENHGLGKKDYLLKADDFEWRPPKSGFVPNEDNPINKEWIDAKNRDDSLDWYDEMVMISKAMRDAADDEDCDAAEKLIKQYIDIESLTTFIAINTIMLEYDVLNQNFLLHKRSTGGKWSHLFWDKDQGLDFQRQKYEISEYYNHPVGDTYREGVMFEMAMTYNNLYTNFLRVKGNFETVKEKVMELTASDGPLSGAKFAAAIKQHASRVRSYIKYGYDDTIELQDFDQEIFRLLDVYSSPSKLFGLFEEKRWGTNSKSRPFCKAWSSLTPSPTASPTTLLRQLQYLR